MIVSEIIERKIRVKHCTKYNNNQKGELIILKIVNNCSIWPMLSLIKNLMVRMSKPNYTNLKKYILNLKTMTLDFGICNLRLGGPHPMTTQLQALIQTQTTNGTQTLTSLTFKIKVMIKVTILTIID